jgi:hypothetical protein
MQLAVGKLCFIIFISPAITVMSSFGGDAPFNFIKLGSINCAIENTVEGAH